MITKSKYSDWYIGLIAIFAPLKPILLAVTFLVLVDMITGIWSAVKNKQKVTSAKMGRTISKFLVYNLCVISAFILEQYLIDGLIPVSKLVSGVIGMVEVKSILENANKITGINIFREVIQRLSSKSIHTDTDKS